MQQSSAVSHSWHLYWSPILLQLLPVTPCHLPGSGHPQIHHLHQLLQSHLSSDQVPRLYVSLKWASLKYKWRVVGSLFPSVLRLKRRARNASCLRPLWWSVRGKGRSKGIIVGYQYILIKLQHTLWLTNFFIIKLVMKLQLERFKQRRELCRR